MEENKRYSITQVAEILNNKPYVLRAYENEFDMEISRGNSNRRYYTKKEISYFRLIEQLKNKGYEDKDIKTRLPYLQSEEKKKALENEERIVQMTFNENNGAIEDVRVNNQEFDELFKMINSLKNEIQVLSNNNAFKEKDELITENARLKMKLKEKTYELVNLREKYEQNKKKSKKKSRFKI